MNFCCHDNYTETGVHDPLDVNILNAYVQYLQSTGNVPPQDIPTFLTFYEGKVSSGAVASLGNKDIEVLPVMDCANFVESGTIDPLDVNILNAYVQYMQSTGNVPPQDIPAFLTFYEGKVGSGAVAGLGNKTILHLPSLEADTQVITSSGLVEKCVTTELEKLWISFTGNDHYSDWYEMETDEQENFTKFKIATPNYGTDLYNWASGKATNLQGILMTASLTKPSAGSLTEEQKTKTYNSDLLKFKCNMPFPQSGSQFNSGHELNDDQVNLRVQAYNNQDAPAVKKYGSHNNTHDYLREGKPWHGANMVYRTTTFNSIVTDDSGKDSIDIDYIYFIKERDENAKIKFSEASPENSICSGI